MRYYLDCEFDGFGGDLLSLALVRQDDRALYIILDRAEQPCTPWVTENVLPVIDEVPEGQTVWRGLTPAEAAHTIRNFLLGDPSPHIIADWPDDLAYFCRALMTGPGEMVSIARLTFDMMRVKYPPHAFDGRVQHNALSDAQVLKSLFD